MGLAATLVLVVLVIAPATVWASAALWFDGPSSRVAALALAGGLVLGVGGLWIGVPSTLWAGLVSLALLACVFGWWVSLKPRNDREWLPDVARLSQATFDGSRVTIRNLRNFDYRTKTDYDERWEERTYDLDRLVSVDIALSYWGSPWIAHTILSWGFEGGGQLAISIETRKEVGERYSSVRGFFRHFELYYVVGDERDVLGQRTHVRHEEVYLYRLQVPLEVARALLVDYLEEIDRIAERPRWYNAALLNCTTAMRLHVQNVGAARPLNWRVILNGRLDELLYRQGRLDRSLPFAELRRRSRIDERARAADRTEDFSARIRAELPGFPGDA